MRNRVNAAWAVLLVLALSACSSSQAEPTSDKPKAKAGAVSSAPASSRPAPRTSQASASPVAPTEWLTEGTQSDGFPSTAGHAFPEKSRVGSHSGFERVVVQYTGTASDLTWLTTWTGEPVDDAKGDRVDVKGDVFLKIDVAGVREPSDVASLPASLNPGSLTSLSTVKGVAVQYPFEGQHSVFIGLSREKAYRVQVLQNPTRLVVDVKKS